MSEVWVLTVKTSLPKSCEHFSDLKVETLAFDSFEKAKKAFREKVKKFAFSKNAMFNKKGQITYLNTYIKDGLDAEDDADDFGDDFLSAKTLSKIQDALSVTFSGQDTKLGIKNGCYTDWMIAVQVKGNSVDFYGDGDGPINGYEPILKTNIFSMEKEQHYYLYIDDCFGQYENTAELYMDLMKAEIQ